MHNALCGARRQVRVEAARVASDRQAEAEAEAEQERARERAIEANFQQAEALQERARERAIEASCLTLPSPYRLKSEPQPGFPGLVMEMFLVRQAKCVVKQSFFASFHHGRLKEKPASTLSYPRK